MTRLFSVMLCALATVCTFPLAGCKVVPDTSDPVNAHHLEHAKFPSAPKELQKTVLPPYIIEPPDVLVIEAAQVLPKQPYYLRALDIVSLDVQGILPEAPIAGSYRIDPNGAVNLGGSYGQVHIAGMTLQQAVDTIQQFLSQRFREPAVSASLVEMAAMQQILGEHLVAMDGTVTLGLYGKVIVAGLTIEQGRCAIEEHLSNYLERPEISVDVYAYNSKKYYIISEGAGLGDVVQSFPITGNDTVLDAIANVNGLTEVSSKRIWIARPTADKCNVQILPIDWKGITALGVAETNYQLLPGDRVFIQEDNLVAFDNQLAKIFAPIERMMGFTILGAQTTTRVSGQVLRGGGNPAGVR